MTTLLKLRWLLVLASVSWAALLVAGENAGQAKGGDTIVILIDAKMRYIKEGDKEQKPVTVKVGQTVVWKNTDACDTHTATSVAKKDGKPIFDTDDIESGKSAKIVFDQKLFEAAGGKAGGQVELPYVCTYHKQGKSSIILKAVDAK
jgi:plastocyanin